MSTAPAPAEGGGRAGISGSLEDVSVADVMQFIHLGRRTGTLLLRRDDERAMIGFHNGQLVSARAPRQPKLGDLLVDSGLVERPALEQALAEETSGPGRRTLGQILLAEGTVDRADLRRVVVEQIEAAVGQVVRWTRGSFEFALDDLRPIDDVALYPGDVIPDADLNTQMVLLEAARIFDEQRGERGEESAGGGTAAAPPAAAHEPDDTADLLGLVEREIGAAPAPERPELQVVSDDDALYDELKRAAGAIVAGVRRTGLTRLGADPLGTPERPAPIVVLDLRGSRPAAAAAVEAVRRARPHASVVALVEPGPAIAAAYEAGAVAALPADAGAVVACVENVLRSRRELAEPPPRTRSATGEVGVARLRRVFSDLRSGLISATVALNLMHIISESVERAVLFLVKRDALVALGAFGSGEGGRSLAELTRGLRLDAGGEHALARALRHGEARTVPFDSGSLPAELGERVGRPRSGQAVVFPVLGAQRVIAVIYTDNGERERPIEDVEILELATAQVGMAFENELLRRQIGDAEWSS